MATKEIKVDGLAFNDGTAQYTATNTRHYASVSVANTGSATFTLARSSFTPNIPVSVSVIPRLEVFAGGFLGDVGAGGASNFGYDTGTGTPFGGTTIVPGAYVNVNINDQLTFNHIGNGAGGGFVDFIVVAHTAT